MNTAFKCQYITKSFDFCTHLIEILKTNTLHWTIQFFLSWCIKFIKKICHLIRKFDQLELGVEIIERARRKSKDSGSRKGNAVQHCLVLQQRFHERSALKNGIKASWMRYRETLEKYTGFENFIKNRDKARKTDLFSKCALWCARHFETMIILHALPYSHLFKFEFTRSMSFSSVILSYSRSRNKRLKKDKQHTL